MAETVNDSPVGQRQFQEFKEGLDHRFLELEKRLDTRFDGVDHRFLELEKRLDARFNAIDKRFDRLERFGFTMLGSLVVGLVFLIFKSL